MSASPAAILCLGDALVDLVGERPGAALAEVEAARVDVSRFVLVSGVQTPLSFATVSTEGEPTYHLHGEQRELLTEGLGERPEDAVGAPCSSAPTGPRLS